MIKINDIYNKLLTESRWKDAYEKYVTKWDSKADLFKPHNINSYDELVKLFMDADTSGSNKYLDYMLGVSMIAGWGVDPSSLVSIIQRFHNYTNRGLIDNKDLYSPYYKPTTSGSNGLLGNLFNAVHKAEEEEVEKQKQKKLDKEVRSEGDTIFEDSRWRVVVPKTHRSSCYYGQGTKWCTTMKGQKQHYESYVSSGLLFYLLDKTKSLKDGDIMYRVAVNWRWIDFSPAVDELRPIGIDSSDWWDAEDKKINSRHILPLLPSKLITAIGTYYHKTIDEHNNKETNKNEEILDELRSYLLENGIGDRLLDEIRSQKFKDITFIKFMGIEDVEYNDWGDGGFEITHIFKNGLQVNSDFFSNINMLYELTAQDIDVFEVETQSYTNLDSVWVRYVEKVFNITTRSISSDICKSHDSLVRFLSKNQDKVLSDRSLEFFIKYLMRHVVSFISQYLPLGLNNMARYKKVGDTVYWLSKNTASTFRFKYPPKSGSMTDKFIKSIKKNPGITNKEFYESEGKVHTPGNNSQFFGSIKDSGIVRVEKGPYGVSKYYIGPNFEDWTKGNLKKYEG